MRVSLAFANVTHNLVRSLAGLGGVTVAILLVFIQLGLYGACERSATLLHDLMDFELVLVSPQYVALRSSSSFPRRRLPQAAAVEGVAGVTGLHVGGAVWRNTETGQFVDVLVLGVDPESSPFVDETLARQVPRLTRDDLALVERNSHAMLGPHAPGTVTEVDGRRLRVVGDYDWGSGFNALGALVVNQDAFANLLAGGGRETREVGLVRLAPGADLVEVQARLVAALPADVRVLSRAEIGAVDRHYWLREKPLGLIFSSGVVLALVVGTVILFQVLAADVNHRLREYATLSAIGYRSDYLKVVVMQQGLLVAVFAFVPAAIVSSVVYVIMRATTHLPIEMSPGRLLAVLGLSIGMCVSSGLFAIRRVTAVDPADLF